MGEPIVVVGGGISGLTCAHALARAGQPVLVLEKEPEPGGSIKSHSRDGYCFEEGPSSFRGTAEARQLCRELGLEPSMERVDPKAPRYLYFKGKLTPMPSGLWTFVRTPLLTWRGKLRVLREPFVASAPHLPDESIADFIRRRLGKEIHDAFVAPLLQGIFAGDTEQLSLRASFPRFAQLEARYGSLVKGMLKDRQPGARLERDRFSFAGGTGVLPRTLAHTLGSRFWSSTRVQQVLPDGDGYEVRAQRDGTAVTLRASAVVLAAPAFESARLLRPLAPGTTRDLQAISYNPVAVVHLGFGSQASLGVPPGFGFLAAPDQGSPVLGTLFTSNVFSRRAPEGGANLMSFLGGPRPEILLRSDEELLDLTR
ncbi:MAG: protoporphyrinogen oxidase, partial [Acidobacteria bacterium]|nr:protoporphyrinogen oxidase [Acidobacteriota bacterium]